MKSKQKDIFLKVIILLSILGFLVSLYLTYNHYAPPTEGSLCDFSESVSCSLVNTSVFSILLNIPVALLGAIWFVFLGLISWKAVNKSKNNLFTLLFVWNILGILFIIYFITAEIILKALCPLCTVVHVIVLVTFVMSLLLYKNLNKNERNFLSLEFLKKNRSWILAIIIINLIPLIFFNLPGLGGEKEEYTELAKCITENGVNMYGSFRCGICAKTRAMFGDSFEHINEIECHPQGKNSQWELCQEKDLAGTPTWILEPNGEELKREVGFLSIEDLKEFSGCNLE